jgi:hypothetical protein
MARIEDLLRREGLSFTEALDRLLRRALPGGATPPRPRRYRTVARPLGLLPDADASRLVDDLEADGFAGRRARS